MFGLTAKAIFGIVMTFIAVVMGVVFTYYNIANSEGPREQKFVLRNCFITWALLFFFLFLLFVIRSPYHYIPLGSLMILFPIMIYRMSLRHQLMRESERRHSPAEAKKREEQSESNKD